MIWIRLGLLWQRLLCKLNIRHGKTFTWYYRPAGCYIRECHFCGHQEAI